VQRAKPPKVGIGLRPLDIERRERQLKGDVDAHKEAREPPKGGGNHPRPYRAVHVACVGDHRIGRFFHVPQHIDEHPKGHGHNQHRMHLIGQIMRAAGSQGREKHHDP